MKIAVTGYKGRVGSLLLEQGCSPLVCDVTNYDEVEMAVRQAKPDLVVHLASISDVDYCEQHLDEALKVNFGGTKIVAEATRKHQCGMVLLSSDHVFGGRSGPYKEVKFVKNFLGLYDSPVNYYGETKLAAEALQQVNPHMKIVRTSYLFDENRLKLANWITDLGFLGLDHTKGVEYPTFISRSFMYFPHFITSFVLYLNRFYEMPNLLHISGIDIVSWYDFMLAVAGTFEVDKNLIHPRRKELNTSKAFAPRPHRGGLKVGLSRKLGLPQYSYIDGLKEMAG